MLGIVICIIKWFVHSNFIKTEHDLAYEKLLQDWGFLGFGGFNDW